FHNAYVCCVALFLQAFSESSYIKFLDCSSYRQLFDLVLDIHKALSIGHPIVICDFEDTSSFEFIENGLL
ncbi:hypothetical protein J3R82DRAFT_2783, partial [Butyriboletus roseoflavus]